MAVRGVLPDARQAGWRAVVDDAPAYEHQPLDEALDCAELVRHLHDRHAELAVDLVQERREGLLRGRVDAGRWLVQDEDPEVL
jgi:hypothetical protein